MEYYNNVLCIPAQEYYHEYADGPGRGEVVEEHCVSYGAYKMQANRGRIKVVRTAGGEGNYALIAYDSIAPKHREQFARVEVEAARHKDWIQKIERDYKAVEYFVAYRYGDGSAIATDKVDNIKLWSNNASILNAMRTAYRQHTGERAKLGKKPLRGRFFRNMARLAGSQQMQAVLENNLPVNPTRLAEKFDRYLETGYESLIKNLKNNDNAIKITNKMARLFDYIAMMPTRPYYSKVNDIYIEFMEGRLELYDKNSGEVMDPAEYLNKKGEIERVTDAAIWNRLSNPAKQAILDKKRLGGKDYNDLHRPHRHRTPPVYSLSKISMDDRDLIWRDKVMKQRPKAYYCYDVLSGCRIGSAYSRKKDEALFLECVRDMFAFVERHGFGIPLEVELEHHLAKAFEPVLKQMIPIVHFCAAGNSQEKRAEHLNRFVKYIIEKNNRMGIGRWYLPSRYNRISVDKVNDEFKTQLKDYDLMVVEDIQDTIQHNNALHPNQKKYPGQTRMQVLINNLNPNLPRFQKHLIYQYIGYYDQTTIMRNQYVMAASEKYMLPHPEILEQLAPNNRTVDAYWMPNDDGTVDSVYLYQNGRYLCEAERIVRYNEAIAERTDADWAAKLKQDKYVTQYDAWVKENLAGAASLRSQSLAASSLRSSQSEEPEIVPDVADHRINGWEYEAEAASSLRSSQSQAASSLRSSQSQDDEETLRYYKQKAYDDFLT